MWPIVPLGGFLLHFVDTISALILIIQQIIFDFVSEFSVIWQIVFLPSHVLPRQCDKDDDVDDEDVAQPAVRQRPARAERTLCIEDGHGRVSKVTI